MSYLLDTSILVRLANSADVQHGIAVNSVTSLHNRAEMLHICPQNLIEFRNVGTRPLANNGLGLSCSEVESITAKFESLFMLLPETPDLLSQVEVVGHAALRPRQAGSRCEARGDMPRVRRDSSLDI